MDKKNMTGTDVNLEEFVIALDVDKDVIDGVLNGEISELVLPIEEVSQHAVLEHADGHLAMKVDGRPDTYYECYMYNEGDFPYFIKESLNLLVLNDGERKMMVRILDTFVEPGMRFNYKGKDLPKEEDPNGDSCIWNVSFEVLHIPADAKTYLMRWNPSISSFTEEDYAQCLANQKRGIFYMDWSIAEWEEARKGDFFYMMRTGDDQAGIVFYGVFLTDPYPNEDWAGSTKRRMYVDLVCWSGVDAGAPPHVALSKLQEAIPSVDWQKGHSGELLSEEAVSALGDLLSI